MRATILILAPILLLARLSWGAMDVPPNDFPQTFAGLSAIVDQPDLSAMDVAKATMLAAKYFSVGAPGLPYTTSRFKNARTPGEASMAGLYMTIHGKTNEIRSMRRELESNPLKRAWLKDLVGSEAQFRASVDQGAQWAPLVRVLPSTVGCKQFSTTCIESSDPLVRRAGLYWGYWVPSPTYWQKTQWMAKNDPEPVTRRIAGLIAAKDPTARKPGP